MTREKFLAHCLATYGTSPDFPFEGDQKTAVLRHSHNQKWYALVMRLSPKRLGLPGEGHLDVVNLKLPVEMLPELTVFPVRLIPLPLYSTQLMLLLLSLLN